MQQLEARSRGVSLDCKDFPDPRLFCHKKVNSPADVSHLARSEFLLFVVLVELVELVLLSEAFSFVFFESACG
jgi:hypothetical protein